jgi:hypothetical protein
MRHHHAGGLAELEAELSRVLVAGGDTSSVRAKIAALQAEASQAADTAARAAAALRADSERALAADAAARATASRNALAARLAQLEPPPHR